MITITPLGGGGPAPSSTASSSGAPQTPPSALCYLIRIDNFYLLLDCGAPEDLRFPRGQTKQQPTLAQYTTQEGDIDTEALSRLPLDDAIALIAPRISLVLLSHSTVRHVGLYPYARARLGLTCPAYASLPTAAMGRLVTLEASMAIAAEADVSLIDKRPLQSPPSTRQPIKTEQQQQQQQQDDDLNLRDRCIPTRAEVDEAFENLRTLRYLQPTVLDGHMSSLSLTAHSAGHTLGGTVWKLRSPTSGTVVLAIDWNHVKERHIDGSGVIEGASASASSTRRGQEAAGTKRAEILVTSGAGLGKVNPRRKDKDKKLLDLIHDTLTNAKSTLHLPLDASPRLLEILLLLDQHWAYSYPHARFPLCLVSKTGKEVIERARTMREWMGRNVQGDDDTAGGAKQTNNKAARGRDARDGQGHGPLEFRFLRIFTSLQALSAAVPSDSAKVVITVGPSLLYGPSLRFFRQHVSQDSKHVLVLTQTAEAASLASTLRRWWLEGQGKGYDPKNVGHEITGNGREVDGIILREKIPLQGAELETYLEGERVKKEREEQHRALAARSRRRLEADEEDDEESDDGSGSSDSDSGDDDDDDADADEGAMPSGGVVADALPRNRKGRRGGKGKSGVDDGNEPSVHATGEGDLTMLGAALSHDIYLKGNASRTTNFFGSSSGALKHLSAAQDGAREARERHGVGVRFRTFPVVEKRKRVDAFGEVIDVGRWLSRGRRERQEEEERVKREAEAATLSSNAGNKRRRLGGAEEDDDDHAGGLPLGPPRDLIDGDDEFGNVPTKFMTEEVSLRISCRIACIDLEGLIDGRALSIVLPQLAPRRLVLVNTPEPISPDQPLEKAIQSTSTKTARFIESLLAVRDFTQSIYAPGLGEEVSVGAQVKAFDVKLGEGLLESIQMGMWEEWSLGWIAGRVGGGGVGQQQQQQGQNSYLQAAVSLDRILGGMVRTENQGGEAQNTDKEAEKGGEKDEEEDATRAVYLPGGNARRQKEKGSATATAEPTHPTVFVGDVRLSKLKSALSSSHRIPAEFGGSGVLVCGSAALSQAGINSGGMDGGGPATANQASAAVTVRKLADRIVIEGNAGRTFVKVRDAVYGMHARIGDV